MQISSEHFMNYSQVTWETAITGIMELYSDTFQCSTENKISTDSLDDQKYEITFGNQFQINSLFHQKFTKLLGKEMIKQMFESLKQLDFESPTLYNLGRNSSTDIAFTQDFRFALKTITANNYFHFKKVLNEGYFTIMENTNSLLAKIYGVYQIEIVEQDYKPLDPHSMEHKRNTRIYFILMENLFYESRNQKISFVFDLKGAETNRETTGFDESLEEYCKNGNGFLKGKDLDFMKLNQEMNPFNKLSSEDRQNLYYLIVKECRILFEAQIMDYSLMLIVSYSNVKIQNGIKCWRNLELKDGGQLTVGIIDYLQEYNSSKFIERKFKQLFGIFKESNIISCCDSENYQLRFIEFCRKVILEQQ